MQVANTWLCNGVFRRQPRLLHSNPESTSALFSVVTVQQPKLLYSTLSSGPSHQATPAAAGSALPLKCPTDPDGTYIGNKRPNPLSLSTAIKRLSAAGEIQTIPKPTPTETPFYASSWVDLSAASFQALLSTKRHLYLVHKGLTERNEFCSDVLEALADAALLRSGAIFRSRFPKQNLPPTRPLDFVVEINRTPFGGEIKNYREWLYPDSSEIWQTISKCCELDLVPVLITRKLPYVSFLLFKKAGMIGYQTHFQYFHPVVEPELARVKSVDGLGYKDIRCVLEPDKNMISFFQKTLPKIGPEFRARFASNKPLLLHFADVLKLRDDSLNPRIRNQAFSEAWNAFFGGDLPDELII